MDLKDYREQPDNGLFEKIERRLRHRRLMRRAGVAAGVVAVVAVVAVTLWPAGEANEAIVASRVALQQPAVQPQSVAAIDSVDTVAPAVVTQHTSVNRNQQNPDRIAPFVAAKEASDDAVTETRTLSISQTQASQVDAVELNTVYEAPRKVVSEQPKTQPKQTVAVPDTVYHFSVPVKNDPTVEPVPHEDNLLGAQHHCSGGRCRRKPYLHHEVYLHGDTVPDYHLQPWWTPSVSQYRPCFRLGWHIQRFCHVTRGLYLAGEVS